jgi:hypothetical protein
MIAAASILDLNTVDSGGPVDPVTTRSVVLASPSLRQDLL